MHLYRISALKLAFVAGTQAHYFDTWQLLRRCLVWFPNVSYLPLGPALLPIICACICLVTYLYIYWMMLVHIWQYRYFKSKRGQRKRRKGSVTRFSRPQIAIRQVIYSEPSAKNIISFSFSPPP